MVITKTKSQLRKYKKVMLKVICRLKYSLAIDKTFIGRIINGVKFLGNGFEYDGFNEWQLYIVCRLWDNYAPLT